MSLVARLFNRAFGVMPELDEPDDDDDELSAADELAVAQVQAARHVLALQAEIVDLRRRNREYFDVIEGIERQRNEWKDMFFDQSGKNMNAHAMYRRQIESLATQFKKAVVVLNGFCEVIGHEPIKSEEQLMALADKLADDYREHVDKLKAAASKDIDGLAARARIAEVARLDG